MRSSKDHTCFSIHQSQRGRFPGGESCRSGGGELGYAKVQNFHNAIAAKHDVVGFDVAMDNAHAVSGTKSGGDLNTNIDRLGGFKRHNPHSRAQGLAFNELGGDELR